jgi:hypothetical protein
MNASTPMLNTTQRERDEWRTTKGSEMSSAIGEYVPSEYVPSEFWALLDDVDALVARYGTPDQQGAGPPLPTLELSQALEALEVVEHHCELRHPTGKKALAVLKAHIENRAASGSPPAMPTRWWCESCGAVMTCTTENGDIICEHKHIVASCVLDVGASSGSTGDRLEGAPSTRRLLDQSVDGAGSTGAPLDQPTARKPDAWGVVDVEGDVRIADPIKHTMDVACEYYSKDHGTVQPLYLGASCDWCQGAEAIRRQAVGSTGGAPTRDELAKIVGEAWASADTETLDDDLLAASTEVRAAVREALATLAAEMFEHDSWGSSTVIEFRDREYSALSSESPDTERKT